MGVEEVVAGKFDNFAAERYRDPLNMAELPADLWSLLVEMDAMKEVLGGVTVRQMVLVPGEGFFHQVDDEWVKYSQFFYKAIESTSSSEVRGRFEAERMGWKRSEEVLSNPDNEVVVLASHPGEVYEFPGMKPLSATFVLTRAGEKNLEIKGKKVNGVEFDAFSLYVDKISIEEHLQIVGEVGELIEKLNVITPLSLVATPFLLERIIDNLDLLVQGMGFEDWEQIEKKAIQLQKLQEENGDVKSGRRFQIVSMLNEMVEISLSDSGEFELNLVSEVIKRVLAKEAIGFYSEKKLMEVRQDIQLTLLHLHRENGRQIKVGEVVDPFTYDVWQGEQSMLMESMLFQRMMSAHGGGGVMVGKDGQVMSMDLRANQLVNYESRRKNKKTVKCGCGEKIARERIPCKCPKCNESVSTGGT